MALSANLLFLVASVHAAARVELGRPLGDVPGWTRGARSSGGENVTLHVFMRHSTEGVAALERRLREVSEPSSAAYGRYVRSLAELEALSPIADEQLALALRHFGPLADAVEPNPNRDILKVHTSAARAERLFGSAFHHFSHANGATALRASAACSLPSEVAGAVWAVSGLLELPILKESNPSLPELRRPSMDEPVPVPGAWPNTCGDECAGLITPGVLHYAYGVPNSTVGMGAYMRRSNPVDISLP